MADYSLPFSGDETAEYLAKARDFSGVPLDDGIYAGTKSFQAYDEYLNDSGALFKLNPSVALGYTINVPIYPEARLDPNLIPYTSFESASTEAIEQFNEDGQDAIGGIELLAEQQRDDVDNSAEDQRKDIEQEWSDQQVQFEETFAAQFTYLKVGNISEFIGDTLTDTGRLNSYQFPDDSDKWYGPIQSQTFPIVIPADPSNDAGWTIVSSVSELKTIALALNIELGQINNGIAGQIVTDYIYRSDQQKTYSVPADAIGKTIVSVVGSTLSTTDLSEYTLETVKKTRATKAEAQANTLTELGDTIIITDRSNGVFEYVLASGVTSNTYNILECTGNASLSLQLVQDSFVFAKHYHDDATDIGAAWNFADQVADDLNLPLIIPAGSYSSSIGLTWDAVSHSILGAGVDLSIITFTNDVQGIRFRGGYIDGIQFVGIGAGATQVGMLLEQNQRHVLGKVRCNSFYDGFQFTNGNLSHFENISARNNVRHGWYNDALGVDSNSITVGVMDLSNNGGDGLHFEPAAPPWVSQQWSGGIISCQSNGGKGFNISGRGHKLAIYDENNGEVSALDSTCVGSEISIVYTDKTPVDNGTRNDLVLHRVGAVECVQHQFLQAKVLEVREHGLTGQFEVKQDRDRVMQIAEVGSSANSLLEIVSANAESISLTVQGSIIGRTYTPNDLATAFNVAGVETVILSNSAATAINSMSSAKQGQEITLIFRNNNTTIVSSTSIRLAGGANFVGSTFNSLTLIWDGLDWIEKSRSINA